MTEELKQKAIENVCKRNPFVEKEWFIDAFKKYDKGETVNYLKEYEIDEYESYIAGATENGIQWHDLRKDPNDLPKGYGIVWTNKGGAYHDSDGWFDDFGHVNGVIAWCAPVFKE